MPITGDWTAPFKWFYRPESKTPSPIVVVAADPLREVPQAEIPAILREIDDRHWSAIRQLLIEAKVQSEMQLRADQILSNPALVAHYQGWANCSDFILGSLEALRNGQNRQE